MTATRTAALIVATLFLATACSRGPDPAPATSGGAAPTGPASRPPEHPAATAPPGEPAAAAPPGEPAAAAPPGEPAAAAPPGEPAAAAPPGATAPPGEPGAAAPVGSPVAGGDSGGRRPDPAPSQTAPTRVPTGGADPDRRGDLVRGYRSLTGTVERSGGWVLLRADGTTWALLGARADSLPDGRGATVAGVRAPLPPGCPADHALTLR